jgi:hypothetical protein
MWEVNMDQRAVTEKVWESDSVTDVSEEEDVPTTQSPSTSAAPIPDKASPIKQEKKKQSSLFKFLRK